MQKLQENDMDERRTQMNKAALYKKRKRRKRRRIFILSCFILGSIGILLFIFKAPFFNTKKIICSGEKILTEKQVTEKTGIYEGQNIFSISMSKTEEKIKELAYVETVKVKRVFPDTIEITIKECTPAAYISLGKKFALIDSYGKILETPKKNDKYRLMEIKGVKLKNPTVGKTIENGDDMRIKYCIDILGIMAKHKLTDKACQLDLSKLTGIKINYDNRIFANCGSYGSYEDFENKLRTLKHLIDENISEVEKVEVDLTMENIVVGPYEDEEAKKKRLEKEKEENASNSKEEDIKEEENQTEEDANA